MPTRSPAPPTTIGVSLKTYLTHAATLAWARDVADLARRHPAVRDGVVELFVAPTFPALVPVRDLLAGSDVLLAAQDVAPSDAGAQTGEVTAAELAEIGVSLAEIGHAERRAGFGEDDATVAAKTAVALGHGLTPLLCVGEPERVPADLAALEVTHQVDRALGHDTAVRIGDPTAAAASPAAGGPLVVAYEPVWAIGAPEPAPADHIVAVVAALEAHLAGLPGREGSRVLYGGSAGPGLLTALEGRVGGLFLGRFAHDVAALGRVLDEALELADRPGTGDAS